MHLIVYPLAFIFYAILLYPLVSLIYLDWDWFFQAPIYQRAIAVTVWFLLSNRAGNETIIKIEARKSKK